MPRYGSSKRKNRKEESEDDDDNEEQDEGSVNEDDEEKPKKKAAKKTPAGEVMVDIGAKKKLTFSKYKGIALVGIREYYEDKKTGEEKPGSKGISLSVDQWEELKSHIEEIDEAIAADRRE